MVKKYYSIFWQQLWEVTKMADLSNWEGWKSFLNDLKRLVSLAEDCRYLEFHQTQVLLLKGYYANGLPEFPDGFPFTASQLFEQLVCNMALLSLAVNGQHENRPRPQNEEGLLFEDQTSLNLHAQSTAVKKILNQLEQAVRGFFQAA